MTSNTNLEEEVLVEPCKTDNTLIVLALKRLHRLNQKTLKSKNIHVSEIKSIIHDMFTHWDIENSELNIDRYFNELCDCVRDTYNTYIYPKN